MNDATLKILSLCERADIVSCPEGFCVVVAYKHLAVVLHESGEALYWSTAYGAAEAVKHAIRPNIPIGLSFLPD